MIWRLAQGEAHVLPAQAEDLTMGEIELLLDQDTGRGKGPEGTRPMTPSEMEAASRRRREGSLADRIRRARRG